MFFEIWKKRRKIRILEQRLMRTGTEEAPAEAVVVLNAYRMFATARILGTRTGSLLTDFTNEQGRTLASPTT